MNIKKSLDCIGLFCPMPVVKTQLTLETMNSGEILEITADDPGFERDLPAWCDMTGNKFLEMKKEGTILKGYIAKK